MVQRVAFFLSSCHFVKSSETLSKNESSLSWATSDSYSFFFALCTMGVCSISFISFTTSVERDSSLSNSWLKSVNYETPFSLVSILQLQRTPSGGRCHEYLDSTL